MKKLFLQVFLTLFVTCVNNTYSQNVSTFTPKINNIPTSPEAALLGRFGDIPIGYYTGTAEISIPIYTIKEAGVEIPIQLRYHSSGIKVDDEATWVGLGWDLSPGGEIIQEVRGKRDDMDVFYGPSLPEGYDYLKNKILANGPSGIYKFMKHYCYSAWGVDDITQVYEEPYASNYFSLRYNIEKGGGQPDIYHFNFGGHSGKFYINFETNEIVQIEKKENIIFEKNGINSITAKTPDGILYQFGVVEMAYNTDVLPDDVDKVGKTYKLSSIILLNGNTIDFSYIDTSSSNLTYQESYMIVENCNGDNQNVKGLRHRLIKNDLKTLSSISTKDAVVNFILEDREDIITSSPTTPNPKRLKAIEITSKGTINKKIKSFEFGYSYFPYNENIGVPIIATYLTDYVNTNRDRLGKRLKLDFVKEIGYDDNEVANLIKPPYSFEYDVSTIMPLKISFAKDFWGYYNGNDNKSLLPDLKYFDYNYESPYFQPKIIPGQGTLTYQLPFSYGNYTGVNRYTDNSKAGAYMLKKINYPTGGFSEFEFEPNSFTNQFIPDKSKGVYKLNDIQDNNTPSNIVSKTFKLSKSTTITFDNSITAYNVNLPPYSYQEMLPSYIELLKVDMTGGSPVVTSIKKWDLNSVLNVDFTNNNGQQWNDENDKIRIEYDPNPNVSYTVNVYMPDNLNNPNDYYHSSSVRSRFYYYDDTGVDTSISNQCGMRIKSIKNYTKSGSLASNKSILYYDGKLLNRFEPLSAKETFCHFREGTPDGNTVSVQNEISISSDNLVNNEGNLIGYGRVEEMEIDKNGDNIGKKEYSFYNTENLNSKNLPIISTGLNGLLVIERSFEKNNLNFLYQKTNSYQDLNTEQYFYGTVNVHRLSGLSTYCAGLSPGVIDYSLSTYPIISRFIKLKSSTIRNKFNGNDVTTTEDYTYNSKGSISTVTTKNSNNEALITKYFYPNDPEMFFKPNAVNLTNINWIENPLVTQTFKGTKKLSEKEIQYGLFGNIILPQYVYAGKAEITTEKRLSYDQYDNKGNLLQYTLENGTPVAIIWGYNQTLPVAKIENATYSQASAVYTTNDTSFRNSLPNAMVTTYTYNPLIGVTSFTDVKGETIYYHYDNFNRLEYVKDAQGKILSKNEYHYKNQQ